MKVGHRTTRFNLSCLGSTLNYNPRQYTNNLNHSRQSKTHCICSFIFQLLRIFSNMRISSSLFIAVGFCCLYLLSSGVRLHEIIKIPSQLYIEFLANNKTTICLNITIHKAVRVFQTRNIITIIYRVSSNIINCVNRTPQTCNLTNSLLFPKINTPCESI